MEPGGLEPGGLQARECPPYLAHSRVHTHLFFARPAPTSHTHSHTKKKRKKRKELGPSFRTQSTRLHPRASTQYANAPAAAILRRSDTSLLTLAPTRRAKAPPKNSTQERKPRPWFPATACPADSRKDSIGCQFASRDLKISREVSEGQTPVYLPPLCAPPPPPPRPPPPPLSPAVSAAPPRSRERPRSRHPDTVAREAGSAR